MSDSKTIPSQTNIPSINPYLHPVAVVLAWVIPGLGHIVMGKVTRGLILTITILSIYTAGIFIGGIGVIDSRSVESTGGKRPFSLWFLGQSLIGPSLALNYYNHKLQLQYAQQQRNDYNSTDDGVYPFKTIKDAPYEPSFSKTNEQALVYTSLAGLLNLLTIIDLIFLHETQKLAKNISNSKSQLQATL